MLLGFPGDSFLFTPGVEDGGVAEVAAGQHHTLGLDLAELFQSGLVGAGQPLSVEAGIVQEFGLEVAVFEGFVDGPAFKVDESLLTQGGEDEGAD